MNQGTKQSIPGINPNTGQYGTLYQVDTDTKKPGWIAFAWGMIKGAFRFTWKVARTADVIIRDDSFSRYLMVAVLSVILFKYIGAVSIILITALALVTLIRLLFNEEGKKA
ncbi:MAG: hypothetical protein GX556_15970 [Fibrobacter sp.]|nr:hypothetical protein [Fibrobacter sp.]